MNERISVGSSFGNGWFIACIVVAVIALVAGGVLLTMQPEPGLIVLAIGGTFSLIAVVQGTLIARGRKWITPTAEGFTYEDRRGTFDFSDDDIVEIGTWAKRRMSNGVPKGYLRKCRLILEAGEYRGDLQFSYSFPITKPDPLAEFLERNLVRLTENAAASLLRGEAITGDSWILDSRELICRSRRQSESFPVNELIAADVVDNQVCIWIRQEPKPIAKFPAEELNALILLRHLNKQFTDQGIKVDDEPGLGRIIFERDQSFSKATLVFVVILCSAMGLGSLYAAYLATKERDPSGLAFLSFVLFALATGIFAAVWLTRISILRCHTKGIVRITRTKTRELQYKDIQVFTYGAIRQYVNGSYTGTTVTMKFEPAPHTELEPIQYSATQKHLDGELENLRDHISTIIAKHMKERLDRGEDLDWTTGLVFTKNHLKIDTPGGILSKAKSRKLPYENCLFSLNEGYFFLFKRGGKDAIYSIPVSTKNFFPGFILLNQLSFEANQRVQQTHANPETSETEE